MNAWRRLVIQVGAQMLWSAACVQVGLDPIPYLVGIFGILFIAQALP